VNDHYKSEKNNNNNTTASKGQKIFFTPHLLLVVRARARVCDQSKEKEAQPKELESQSDDNNDDALFLKTRETERQSTKNFER
tara:strand:+ start:607 stop:855 length:249 start_codon:yes stop_codon:yes gene_type:complete